MKIHGFETNEVLLKEIGARVKSKRIAMNLTQKALANESGVSQRTISGFENGENISLDNLLSLLRVLRLTQNLNVFLPEEKINPFDVLKKGQKRQRVYPKRKDSPKTWKWEDES